jgi:long-chain acyl-CoA synthetase
MTIVEMLERNAKLLPEKTAIIYGDSKISYREFYERSNMLANFLIANGLKNGERVGLLVQKTPEAIISFLGVAAAGGIVFPIDYTQTVPHIQLVLDITDPVFLIVDESFQPLLSKVKLSCPDEKIIVIGKKTAKKYRNWDKIFVKEKISAPEVSLQDSDVVYLNFTSGTTGVPKGAVTTHANIFWNTLSSVESLKLRHDDIHLCMFPVFVHPHELFSRPLYLGGTIVLIDNISPKSIARRITDCRVTCMMAVASIYDTLVRLHDSFPFDFSSLRIPESGGMHINPALAKRFEERFGINIIPVWGSTETSGIALAASVDEMHKIGSMGKPCRYYEVKILGEDGEELPPNEVGEMAVRGSAVCSGYYNQPEETEKYLKDGWFFSGDMVKKDTEGYLYFASRKSGMMKMAGLKVFPTEIEDVLIAHPKIAEVAVVKVQDHSHGEVPKAVIVLKDASKISKSDIKKFCEERMSKYKVPRIIEFMTELPRTSGGKIRYRELV